MKLVPLTTALALALCLASPSAAQTARILRKAGDSVGPANLVSLELHSATRVGLFPESGTVLFSATTDAPADSNELLLSLTAHTAGFSIGVLFHEGDPEPGAPAAPLLSFPAASQIALGRLGHGSIATVLESGFAPFPQTHLYWDGTPIARYGERVAVSGLPFGGPVPLIHVGFRQVLGNDARQVLATTDIWPRFADTVPPFPVLVRYQLDVNGAATSAALLLDAGADALRPTPYRDLPHDPRATDMDETGRWITRALGVDGRWRVVRDGVELALEGGASPVAGRTWSDLGGDQPVALGTRGGHAFLAGLSGDSASARVVVQDGALLAQQGEVLAPLATPIEPRVDTNLVYAGDGRVLWLGDMGGGGQALVRGREILLASWTRVAFRVLVGIEGFVATPDGRFVFVDAVLETGPALLLLDLGAAELLAPCASANPCTLTRSSGAVVTGAVFRLALDGPVPAGSLAKVKLARSGSSCEASYPFGEIYLTAGSVFARQVLGVHAGSPITIALAVPNDPGLVGLTLYGQGSFVAPPGSPTRLFLSNGLRFEVGAP